MDTLQLRDEAVRDRVRAAQEFLDPRMSINPPLPFSSLLTALSRPCCAQLQIRYYFDATEVSTKTRSQYR